MYCNCSSQGYHGCNPCQYFSTIGTSVSRWCSSGTLDAPYADYAFLTRTNELTAEAGEPIQLNGPSMVTGAFSYANGLLTISQPGIYRLCYIVNLPFETMQDPGLMFYVRAGENIVAGTQASTQGPGTLAVQAIFEVTSRVSLALVCTTSFSVNALNEGDVLASLLVEKLA